VNCRKLSGAPFTAQALAKATAVEVRSARDAEMDQMVFLARRRRGRVPHRV
jgi:hypothetical protein